MNVSKKLVVVSCLGTVLEWAEFTFYAYIAATVSTLFFPNMSHQKGIIATFVIFAIGYFMRPVGALLFGYIGDRLGRRIALQASILLMGVSAVCIGLLPRYSVIGEWAPALLLLFRCLQGLAVAGEFNGSSIFLMEHAKAGPYYASSWAGWSSAFGMMLGSFAALIVVLPVMADWAWRVPFLSGALICVCGFYLRLQFEETPEFLDLLSSDTLEIFPVIHIFRHHLKNFVIAVIFASISGVYIYVANVFYATHLIKSAGLQSYQAKIVVTVGTLLVMLMFPVAAKLADRYGGRRIMCFGLIMIIIAAPALYLVTLSHSLLSILLVQVIYAIAYVGLIAPLFGVVNELFPVGVRYTGASFAWSVSMAIFGGTAPLIATWLQSFTHLSYSPAIYIMAAAMLGLAAMTIRVKSF